MGTDVLESRRAQQSWILATPIISMAQIRVRNSGYDDTSYCVTNSKFSSKIPLSLVCSGVKSITSNEVPPLWMQCRCSHHPSTPPALIDLGAWGMWWDTDADPLDHAALVHPCCILVHPCCIRRSAMAMVRNKEKPDCTVHILMFSVGFWLFHEKKYIRVQPVTTSADTRAHVVHMVICQTLNIKFIMVVVDGLLPLPFLQASLPNGNGK